MLPLQAMYRPCNLFIRLALMLKENLKVQANSSTEMGHTAAAGRLCQANKCANTF